MCHVNQAFCSPAVRGHRDCENNYNTFIFKLGDYVEMQIFGRLLRVERDPARFGDSRDLIYGPACWLWQALLFYAMIDGSIS